MLNHEWFDISTAPKEPTAVWIKGDGEKVALAHYACDLSGEEQPPFEGYFYPVKDSSGRVMYYRQVPFRPAHWRPVDDTDAVSVGGKQLELPGVVI